MLETNAEMLRAEMMDVLRLFGDKIESFPTLRL